MTVAAALRELEKIEMIRGSDNEYHLDHAVTATQKTILSAFGMASQDIKKKAQAEVFHLKDKYDAAGVEWTSEKETRSSETGDPESDRSKSAIA